MLYVNVIDWPKVLDQQRREVLLADPEGFVLASLAVARSLPRNFSKLHRLAYNMAIFIAWVRKIGNSEEILCSARVALG